MDNTPAINKHTLGDSSTSVPESRKAHGNAGTVPDLDFQEPRQAGLHQTWKSRSGTVPKALLEQPSPSCIGWQLLG
jgi:hypothetical protein